MGYSVKERAEIVGTFRWINVQAMEMLARWIPITPEMEIKVLFGRHVWEFAQHADVLGKRAFELRAPLHFSLPACAGYQAWLAEISALTATAERVSVCYDVLCPSLANRYRSFIAATDTLMDEPTVRILERALADLDRMVAERLRLPAPLQYLSKPGQHAERSARESAILDVRPAAGRDATAAVAAA